MESSLLMGGAAVEADLHVAVVGIGIVQRHQYRQGCCLSRIVHVPCIQCACMRVASEAQTGRDSIDNLE